VKVRWSARAEADLEALVTYIARDSVAAALTIQERLLDAAYRLGDFAERGRKGRISGTRELVVTGTPYVVVYKLEADELSILHVVHGAQDWPPEDGA
jgi:toxin ParE1/3/4